MDGSRGKILVIRGGAIGDFVLTLPVLAALRKNFPQSELSLLGYVRATELALNTGLVHNTRSIDARPLAQFFARHGTLSDEWSDYFGSFALIISYLFDPDEIFKTNVSRCSKAQFLQGPHRPNESEKIHATDVFLKPLERLAIFGEEPVPQLVFGENVNRMNQIAIHPGSGSEKKNWPEEKWSELLELLVGKCKCDILLIGGEAEGEKLHRLARKIPESRLRVAQNLPLSELAGLMSGSSFFLGHDSGITHLASALGLRGLVLWGESNFEIWRPRSEKMKVIMDHAGLQNLAVHHVFREVEDILGK